MTKNPIVPDKIHKPIQLLGAWLAGLFAVDSCFLFAAVNMAAGSFGSIALVIASIANVPIFLAAVFLLQTRFRPELQEDSYYSTYLSQRTNEPISVRKKDKQIIDLERRLTSVEQSTRELPARPGGEELLSGVLFGVNKYLDNPDEIKRGLKSKGILGISSFGNSQLSKPKQAVAISEYLPKQVQNYIVEIAKELGATHYSYFDNQEEGTEEDVLFGGYNAAQIEIA